MKKMEKGITIVALIITIVILLILASIAISSMLNDVILEKAENSAYLYNQASENEANMLKQNENWLNNKKEVWTQEKNIVKKGDTILKVGQVVNYDETNGGEFDKLVDVEWKVLGAENGELLVMSTKDIGTKILVGIDGCANGVAELNEMCEAYGKGSGALGARCINVEDINRITGYDPNNNGQGKKYKEGDECEYGIQKLYEKNSEYFNFETHQWVKADKQETLTSNYYSYYPLTLTENDSDPKIGLNESSSEYKLLFKNNDGTFAKYWLASEYTRIFTNSGYANYGLRAVDENEVQRSYLIIYKEEKTDELGVRAVVRLDKNISLEIIENS